MSRPPPDVRVSVEGVTGIPWIELPLLPPRHRRLDTLFFRRLFHRAGQCGLAKDGAVHADTFRRLMQRISDSFGSKGDIAWTNDSHVVWVTWKDVRRFVMPGDGGAVPLVKMNYVERLFLILESDGCCLVSLFFRWVIFAAIVISIGSVFGEPSPLDSACMVLFSVEYGLKLLCAPFIRIGLFSSDELLKTVLPDSTEKALIPTFVSTRASRLWQFVSKSMNIIDFLAILPFLMSGVMDNGSSKFGFLRAFRVLRLFRVLSLGKFNSTVAVLGDVIGRSYSAAHVLIFWVVMASITIGPLLYQLEANANPEVDEETGKPLPWSFDTVPGAAWWVSGRLCNMHYNIPEKGEFPWSKWGAPVVLLIGLIKSPGLLAAVGKLKSAFTEAQAEHDTLDRLTKEDAQELSEPLGTEWVQSPLAPSAEVEVLDEDDRVVGACMFSLPLLEAAPQNLVLTVPVQCWRRRSWFSCGAASPAVDFQVVWRPRPSGKPGHPLGRLEVWPVEGRRFTGPADAEWRCLVRVPSVLGGGSGALHEWLSEPSDEGPPEPSWEGQCGVFEVDWSGVSGGAVVGAKPPPSDESLEEQLRQALAERAALLDGLQRA